MSKTFQWKAEIKFNGTEADFNALVKSLETHVQAGRVVVEIPEWEFRPPQHLAGCMPFPIDTILDAEIIKPLIEKSTRININFIRDIRGGIRTPHLHLEDSVVLVDRAQFRTVVAEVARKLAIRRFDASEDYVNVMNRINALGDP